jgi:hypothetical protein
MYKCGWNGCEKAYGTLNHLNAHVTMQSHGSKRTPEGKFSITVLKFARDLYIRHAVPIVMAQAWVCGGRLFKQKRPRASNLTNPCPNLVCHASSPTNAEPTLHIAA